MYVIRQLQIMTNKFSSQTYKMLCTFREKKELQL